MKLWSKLIGASAGMALVGLLGVMLTTGRMPAQDKAPATKGAPKAGAPAAPKAAPKAATATTKGKTAHEAFKNVTTEALGALSPDDFLQAMGVMADALGLDCADCHPGAGTDHVNWTTDVVPAKKTAREMVNMVQAINKDHFKGVQNVTCWTCHHGRERPATTIALDNLYSNPNSERDDLVSPPPKGSATLTAAQILDKYMTALGGEAKLKTLNSYVMSGKSVGYEGLGGDAQFTVYAKNPDMRTTEIKFPDHPDRGQSTWTYNGKTGWISVPRGLLGEFEVEGKGIAGTRVEAQLGFPGNVKTMFTNWRVGQMESIGTKDYYVVQGGTANTVLATLFIDSDTNLLYRLIRYTPSPVGRVTTQIDYEDYKDVGGIKFPFKITFLWLDGRYTAEIKDVKVNTTIEAAKFGKP